MELIQALPTGAGIHGAEAKAVEGEILFARLKASSPAEGGVTPERQEHELSR